jgi:hypothetical protein
VGHHRRLREHHVGRDTGLLEPALAIGKTQDEAVVLDGLRGLQLT